MIINNKEDKELILMALTSYLQDLEAEDYKGQDQYQIDVTKLLIKRVAVGLQEDKTASQPESPIDEIFKYRH